MKTRSLALAALLLSPVLASCAANDSLSLNGDGSGTFTVRVKVEKLFAEYFVAAAESGGAKGKPGKIFDPAIIKQQMEKRPGVTVQRIATPTPETLEVDFAFKDVRTLFSDDPNKRDAILSFIDDGGDKTLKFHLDRKNAKQLAGLFADMSNPAFKELSPRSKRISSEAEYLEAIEFIVGEDGPKVLRSASVELSVQVGGEIKSQTGGALANNAVTFRVPLLRLLLLDRPFDYAVTFAPARKKTPR